jgi:glycosyltransferase involved in cell wall biosynthesis
MKLNILHICDSLFPGGAQKIMITDINNLSEFNHHVIYLAPHEDLKNTIKAPCVYIPQKKGAGLIKTIYAIYKYCKKNNINIITASVVGPIIIGRLVAIFLPKMKFVTTYQGTSYMDYLPKAEFYAKIDRFTQRKRFNYIAVSNAVKEHIHEKVNKNANISVIYNCISNYYFENSVNIVFTQKEKLKFIFIGNNFFEKNIPFLIKVFKQLDPEKFELHVMGGHMEDFIKEIEENNYSNIFFHGLQKITKEMLRSYDVYTAAGIGEGCPLATIEAMAIGLPTILANTAAYKEVTNNVGYFFDPYNVENGIEAFNNLYNNQHKLPEISSHHFAYAKNFTEQILIDKMRDYYNNLN